MLAVLERLFKQSYALFYCLSLGVVLGVVSVISVMSVVDVTNGEESLPQAHR